MDKSKGHAKLLLVVVAKAPVAGEVKTRFIPHLTPDEAVALYRCFLKDRILTVDRLKGVDRALAYTPEDAGGMFVSISGNGIDLFCQKGRDLGERLNNIFLEQFAAGYEAVCIIDSDTPDLPQWLIQESFKRLLLSQTDVVFGPCHDGGYYLVGMRRPHPELFEDIPWSTERVLSNTLEKAEKLGVKTDLLPWWNDLDTFKDLVDYYRRHKNQLNDKHWAGKNSFLYLSRMEKIIKGRTGRDQT